VSRRLTVGIDIGGTFTDVVLADLDEGTLHTAKELTTSDRPADAVLAGLDAALENAGADAAEVARTVHATTLATNIVIERRGATVAYVTTEGFGDLLVIGHDRRTDTGKYDLFYEKQPPLVPRSLTVEVPERMAARGEVVVPLDEDRADRTLRQLLTGPAGTPVEAVAVCLIHAYANPEHEHRVRQLVLAARPDVHVVLSSDACPEYRELPRANTTVVAAYVGPMVASYVRDLEARLRARGVDAPLQIMQSNGGTAGAGAVIERPIQLVESGPAAGVIAAAHVGRRGGADDLIAFDMGGTTAKAGLVRDGRPGIATEFVVGGRASTGRRRSATGYEVKLPVVDLAEVGAGGGSIGRVDAGGVLRVGPDSAGSFPGPACYGRGGTLPTVTDADLVLGYIDPEFFLGGRMRVDADAAGRAVDEEIGRPLGMSLLDAAAGMYEIANANMADTIRIITLERGIDPSGFTLVASGGAGPAHVVRLAQAFDIARVIVPPHAGVASALGLVVSDVVVDRARTRLYDQDDVDLDVVAGIYRQLADAAVAEVAAQGFPAERIRVEREVDVRFRYQSHELSVPMADDTMTEETVGKVAAEFRDLYARLYGMRPDDPVELVNYRVRVVGLVDKPDWAAERLEQGPAPRASERPAYFSEAGGYLGTAVYRRDDLGWGHSVAGPAIIEDASTCTVVPPGWIAEVDRWRSLRMTVAGADADDGAEA
jgi:N-methylhydantoinase A